jgi:thiol-disulfide isomerase/thioredoxin
METRMMLKQLVRRLFAIGAMGLMCAALGCADEPGSSSGTARASGEPARVAAKEPATRQAATREVTLQSADRATYDALLKKYRGKVVLVDFWATWCVPCRKGFPHTIQWSKELADKGLVVISVSLDDPEADKEAAWDFLKEQNATFPNLITSLGNEESMEAFEIDGGALPHYKLYGRDGKLLQKFASDEQEPSHKEIEAAIRAALGG